MARLEAIVDTAGIDAVVEGLLPTGGRPRQLPVRTLLVGMLLAAADDRPAHLVRVHDALVSLDAADRRRLGVEVGWKAGPHLLTYRQVERTFSLVVGALAGDAADGQPSQRLCGIVDALMEASIPTQHRQATTALAVDWTDLETWARPPLASGATSADPDASWGHRRGHAPGADHERFFGYYPQAATMVREEHGPAVPELARRLLVTSCHVDPARAFVGVFERMAHTGIALGDVLADSGYAHRTADGWALPLRRLGARLVQDLHPHDRGPKGTHGGAVLANGRLWCPATPPALLALGPLPAHAAPDAIAAHDLQTVELARYKMVCHSGDDPDGYHRVACPALAGKLRCPLRPESMSLPHDRPEILQPPATPRRCCTQRTLTVPPDVNAKTAQKHDYPSATWRLSYARRTGAERTFSTIKDPATTDIHRGWCRLMGLTPITLFLTCAMVVRNQRVLDAFDTRQTDQARRLAAGLPPKRRRRRRTLADLTAA